MRIALLAAIAFGLTATSASAQGVPDRSQAARVDIDDAATCLRLFRANRNAGLLPVLFLAASLLV